MLTIPDSIKALYKTDGVHKNVRIHFPNGEFPDITNDNVVRESLHFTESLCSQDTFRFGLAEASVLEIETVGIGNMYGMTIEASIEIDGSSLSAADKATIAGGTWDGTWDAVEETFSIPLGSFKVDSCPRDHQNMAHRKVTAYTTYTGTAENSPFEIAKLNGMAGNGTYDPDITKIVLAAFGWHNQATRDALTKTEVAPWANISSESHSTTIYISSDPNIYGGATVTRKYRAVSDNLYSLEFNGTTAMQSALDWLEEKLDDDILPYNTLLFPKDAIMEIAKDEIFAWCGAWFTDKDIPIFYPKAVTSQTLYVPTSVTFTLKYKDENGVIQTVTQTITLITSTPSLSVYSDLPASIYASFAATGVNSLNQSTFVDCYKFLEILAGYTSLSGQFGRVDRLGGFKTVTLDPSTPMSVTPTDYSECWWDEYDVSPIGTVTVTYKDSDAAEMTADIEIGSGASRYDMTDNETLRALSSADLTTVEGIITGDFASNAQNVGFTPIDLSMQGWPWLEAGDALEITAEDGTTVETYALRVEMSGIQNLQMAITAQGGQIIGEA